jgi:hypothetical protein
LHYQTVRWSCVQRQHNAASFTTPHVVSLLCLVHSRVVCMCALWDCMAQPDCGEGLCPVVQVCDLNASTPSCFQAQQLRSKRSESFCSVLSARLTYDVGVSAGRSAGHACVCCMLVRSSRLRELCPGSEGGWSAGFFMCLCHRWC